MSKIEKLIKDYYPNGVEYKKLKELFDTRNGYTPSKLNSKFWEGDLSIPWFRMEDIRENGNILYDSIQHVTPEAIKGNILPADSIIVSTSATIGVHALIRTESLANQRFTYLVLKKEYKDRFDIKFLFYYCYKLDGWCLNHLNQSSFASVDMAKFYEFEFPVPPLEVQREIVRVLDSFTLLTAELTAELTARKKQYDYYGNQLFEEIKDEGNIYSIGEIIISLKTGLNPRQNFSLNETGSCYPYITGKDIFDNKINVSERTDLITPTALELINKRAHLEKGLLLFASTGTGTVGRMAIIEEYNNDWGISETLYGIKVDEAVVLPHYLMFFLYSVAARKQFEPKISKGSVPHLKVKDLLDVKIPVPSIEKQREIVKILIKFDSLCNDISKGIPAEINARQKQYEFYRDKLLSFKEMKD